MKVMRKIIEIDEERCDGCGQCVIECAEGALEIVDQKARVVADKFCDGLGACIGDCPNGALKIIEKETDEFDAEAVEEHLKKKVEERKPDTESLACGCPSNQVQTFIPDISCEVAEEPVRPTGTESRLSHWPVQIRLVPPTAPFLKGASLLVASDCAPVAYPRFHEDFLRDRVVLLGCPKFDEVEAYVDKFAQIFKANDIKEITVLIMEVPCCSGLPAILKRAMDGAGKSIPMQEVVISARGKILSRKDQ
ncbi:MAG: 4Fe-4S binding protein [Desulfatiglans sp.]|jgi:NAD-dependent dihydropyrimidine dehydrogenase PreA subunit|nr:4Fe-4S binding protein [Thermodesulfobacteriota bacterium]MEE4353565.1 4Fe-4S binding protein [Desulfatiglans sp.]